MKTTRKSFLFVLVALAVFGLFGFVPVPAKAFADAEDQYVVTANYAYVFQSPNFSSKKLKKLENKSVVTVELEWSEPKKYVSDEYVFFKVSSDGVEGYVYSDLVAPKTKELTTLPNFNAKINQDTKLFSKQGDEYVESEKTLTKGMKIFLYEGFDSKSDFTAIAYVQENEVLYGFVKSSAVAPNGINPLIITCMTIILAVIGIVFTFVFIKRRKSK